MLEQLASKNEELELKLLSKESDLESVIFAKDEMQVKVSTLEEKNQLQKQKIIQLEKSLAVYENKKDNMDAKEIV